MPNYSSPFTQSLKMYMYHTYSFTLFFSFLITYKSTGLGSMSLFTLMLPIFTSGLLISWNLCLLLLMSTPFGKYFFYKIKWMKCIKHRIFKHFCFKVLTYSNHMACTTTKKVIYWVEYKHVNLEHKRQL